MVFGVGGGGWNVKGKGGKNPVGVSKTGSFCWEIPLGIFGTVTCELANMIIAVFARYFVFI